LEGSVVVSQRERLGWNNFFENQIGGEEFLHLQWARVVEEQRRLYRLAGDVDGWAEVSGRFRHEAAHPCDFPAVGDWVGVDRGIIHHRLERRSAMSRAAAGRAVTEQVVAANVDTVFLVTAFGHDLNPRRLERYLTMVWDGGAVPVILLNKADLADNAEAERGSISARLPMVDILVVSALDAADEHGLDCLAAYLRPAQTVALLGSSGVGKSTLINRLLGREALRVRAISETDGKGQHTTTSRQLVALPGGALLIDTPGMRELTPWADRAAVDASFGDIAELAAGCRFADCAHEAEPGCAVLEAVESGRLDADRLEHYRRLGREAAFEDRKRDKAAASELKRKWKQIHQAQRAMYKDRDRG
jgi:ribosome biogenesis GTPase / thiamine phosphate phosphatase